jgi:hypothetical protein
MTAISDDTLGNAQYHPDFCEEQCNVAQCKHPFKTWHHVTLANATSQGSKCKVDWNNYKLPGALTSVDA